MALLWALLIGPAALASANPPPSTAPPSTTSTTTRPRPPPTTSTWPDLPLPVAGDPTRTTRPPTLCDGLRSSWSAQVWRWCPTIEAELSRRGLATTRHLQWHLRTIRCESNGIPTAVNLAELRAGVPRHRLASGLYQHLPRYWPARAAAAGWPGADVFDPRANIAVGVWLWATQGPAHWPHCGR